MPRINIFIADTDKFYSESLGKYLNSNSRNYNISIFTSITAMQKEITGSKKQPDIILISEDFYSPDVNFGSYTFILTDRNIKTNENNFIYKYQTAESILEKINKHMEDNSPSIYKTPASSINTKVISVVSPDGGCGKSVLSFFLAAEIAQTGTRVLLLDLQSVSSLSSFIDLEYAKPGLSDIFYYIKGYREDLSSILNKYLCTNSSFGIDYIPPLANPMDMEELNPEDIEILINELKNLGKFDIIIIDTDSMINIKTSSLMDSSDAVILVTGSGPIENKKLLVFEAAFNKLYQDKDMLKNNLLYINNNFKGNFKAQLFNHSYPVLQIPYTEDIFIMQHNSMTFNFNSCFRSYVSKICRLIEEKALSSIYGCKV